MADISKEELDRLTSAFGDLTGASNEVKQSLLLQLQSNTALYSLSKQTITAEQKLLDLKKQQEAQYEAAKNVFNSVFTAIGNTVKGFITVTSQLYSTTGAFSAVSIGMDAFFGQVKNVVKVLENLGGFFSKFSGWVGISGSVTKAFGQLADGTLDIAQAFIKFKLEALQKQLDTFTQLSKAGISFGGSMTQMIATTKSLGINLQSFSRFIAENQENLSAMGLGMTMGAEAAIKQAKSIGSANAALLTMYGSFENLATGAAEYIALETKAGDTDVRNRANITQSITEYLIRQRQLTELTGMSADAIKRQEEERRKELAYQQALGRTDENTRKNIMAGMAQITAKFGPEAAKYAKEYFSTGGNVISREGIIFRNMMGPVADSVESIMGTLDQNEADFIQNTGKIISEGREGIQQHVQQVGDTFGVLAQAGYGGEIVRSITSMSSHLLQANEAMAQAAELARKILAERQTMLSTPAGDITTAAATAIRNLNTYQIKIDEMVAKDFALVDNLTKAAHNLNLKFLEGMNALGNVAATLSSDKINWKDFSNNVLNLVKAVAAAYGIESTQGREPEPAGPTVRERRSAVENAAYIARLQRDISQLQRDISGTIEGTDERTKLEEALKVLKEELSRKPAESPTKKADGGLANGPTIVGEAGPEAVIPLRQGSVPVNINLDPMLALMTRQNRVLEELAEKMSDSVDIQERLLRASA